MNRRVAILDIDGVLSNTCPASVNNIRRAQGLSPLPLPTGWDWPNYSEEEKAYVKGLLYGPASPKFYAGCEPVDFAAPMAKRLSAHFDICYMTARGVGSAEMEAVRDASVEWLWSHGFPHGDFVQATDKLKTSVEMYGEDVAFIVEDNGPTVEKFLEVGIPAFLVSELYNEYLPPQEGLHRVKNFPEVFDMLWSVGAIPDFLWTNGLQPAII